MKQFISLLVLVVLIFSCQDKFKAFSPKRDTVFVAVNYVGNNLQLDKAIVDSFQTYDAEDSTASPKSKWVMHTRIYLGQWVDTVKDSVKRSLYVKANRPTGYLAYGPTPLLDSLTRFVEILHLPNNPLVIPKH